MNYNRSALDYLPAFPTAGIADQQRYPEDVRLGHKLPAGRLFTGYNCSSIIAVFMLQFAEVIANPVLLKDPVGICIVNN